MNDLQMEKYFIGFDFSDKEKPTLLVGEHNGKVVTATKFISDKKEVEDLYSRLTGKTVK